MSDFIKSIVLFRRKMMNMILMVAKRNEVKNVKQRVIPKKKRKERKEKGVEIVLRYYLYNLITFKLNNCNFYIFHYRKVILVTLKKKLL